MPSLNYTFHLDTVRIDNTRSRHEDSDKASLSAAVGNNAAQTVTKDLGNLNNGQFNIGLSLGPFYIDNPQVGLAFHYIILNSGHQDWKTVNDTLTSVGQVAASKGAQAITAAAGAAVGATVGGIVLPVIGAVLGAALGWAAGQITALITADCDGLVAEAQVALSGQDLWVHTSQGGGMSPGNLYHPGTDSSHGCGSNSMYFTSYTILRS